jgi:hypothetical protein
VVLAAKLSEAENAEQGAPETPGVASARTVPPADIFAGAARGNWGVTGLKRDIGDSIVREHWPFPSPDPTFRDLPSLAAQLSGAKLGEASSRKWIRYYAMYNHPEGPFTRLSYYLAFSEPSNYFRGKTVFIGNKPEDNQASETEPDKFRVPFKSGLATGGVEILATIYLNLMNGDWLRRPGDAGELGILALAGLAFGGGLCFCRRWVAVLLGVGGFAVVSIGALYMNYYLNVWFPWLIIAAGQIPCALAWSLAGRVGAMEKAKIPAVADKTQVMKPGTIVLSFGSEDDAPPIPNYKLLEPAFGKGGFGKVWLARNALGQWQAIKVVYRSKFDNPKPYNLEFNGLRRYKPVSEEHAGLLRVELVSEQVPDGYFYYVMELGDSQNPGWEELPELYKPIDLENLRKKSENQRLPAAECVRICLSLTETLDFLHSRKLIHRDIKPSNVIFVKGRPKLADVGLVSDARAAEQVQTYVGTPGYMPPPPEPPGTVQADIYALGMLLYVVSTGSEPGDFPSIATALMERSGSADFVRLNAIVLKACEPDIKVRYQTAAEMLADLKAASEAMAAAKAG